MKEKWQTKLLFLGIEFNQSRGLHETEGLDWIEGYPHREKFKVCHNLRLNSTRQLYKVWYFFVAIISHFKTY